MSAPKSNQQLILNNLSFRIDDTKVHFKNINLSFDGLRYGIVGDNGIGKTTLLNLISGNLLPDSGSVLSHGKIATLPQSYKDIGHKKTIADILEINSIMTAIDRINNGSIKQTDYDLINNQWDIVKQAEIALKQFNLWPLELNNSFANLSGGQKTKVLLAKIILSKANIIIMDEPTNNLDTQSRQLLYDFISNSSKTIIIVSHDRELLNELDCIVELTTKGIEAFGGNYEFYKNQKETKLAALNQEHNNAIRDIQKSKRSIQASKEKHEQAQSRGKKAFKSGSIDKLSALSKKGRSEKTNKKLSTQSHNMIESRQNELNRIKDQLEVKQSFDLCLDKTMVPSNKTILDIKNITFGYSNLGKQDIDHIFNNYNLNITGPLRLALTGPNGSGKSTLIKLIRQQLTPEHGSITIGVEHIAYLDQEVSFLNQYISIVDNFLELNPQSKLFDAYDALAHFGFRNIDAKKIVGTLSGGEKMRAGLAISLMSSTPPQLIILDEPTNHLDLTSITAIETALLQYQGALLVISHDNNFLKNINVNKIVNIQNQ